MEVDSVSETGTATQTEEIEYLFCTPAVKQPFNEAYFAHDNDKIRFYTGLPAYDVLSKFQEIVLTLMKLKLNMPMQHARILPTALEFHYQLFPEYFPLELWFCLFV